jgi:hypothetical protein
MTSANRLALAAAGFSAVLGFGVPAADAGSFGNAPWCAVQNLGAGDVVWDCQYRSVAECQPQVIAGNRGFCNINPSYVPPVGATSAKHPKRRS